MTAEPRLLRQILRDHGARPDLRLFRLNTGVGWAGDQVQHGGNSLPVQLGPGDVIVRNARPLHAGLCPGGSDLIGWRIVPVTEDMVGQRLALFTAIECKTGRQRPTEKQRRFLDAVDGAGGVAGVARSSDDVLALLGVG